MNSRERVLCAFNRVKSDRVPINYFANQGIEKKLMQRLKVSNYEDLLKALNVDFRSLEIPYTGKLIYKELPGRNVSKVYGHYSKWIENESGGYWDFCDFPLKDADSETIANFPVPSADDFDYSNVYESAKRWKDYAVFAGSPGIADIINSTGRLMGMEDILVNLINEDEATLKNIEKRTDMEIGILQRAIEKSRGLLSFIWMGEDLGTQIAPMISLQLYRKILRPFHEKYVRLAKNYGLPILMHTCGSSNWAYEDFIEMGIDAVDTLQPEAVNMSPKYLVDKFGGRLSFHGCISTKGAVAYGTPEDVEKDVISVYNEMKPTHSYMFAPSHWLQDNSPVENVIKMYECGLKYGKY